MRGADWVTIADALWQMFEAAPRPVAERVPLAQVHRRTLAADVVSPVDMPPWDNSAMDGYAVRAVDVRGASIAAPAVLTVIERIAAGAAPTRAVGAGEAVQIMTGAPVPAGADSVVRVEHTKPAGAGRVAVVQDGDAGRNIRRRGEDVESGAIVLRAGTIVRAAEVGVLAMVGCREPVVARRPRVAVLATGDELVGPDRIDAVIAGTHIINSNTPAVSAALSATGCDAVELGIARDDLADLRTRLEAGLDADALITTAGASVGEHDLVKDALEAIGCIVGFWRVKIRPGSPFSFGVIPRTGRPGLPVFGLPGNPVSALVTMEVLVKPVLRRMLGRRAAYAPTRRAVAGERIRSPKGLVRFLRVRLEPHEDGVPRAHLTGPQGSGILTSVSAADALLMVPLETEVIEADAAVTVVPLQASDEAQDRPGF